MKIAISITVTEASRNQIFDLHSNLPESNRTEKSMTVTNGNDYLFNFIRVKYSISKESLDKIVEILKGAQE